eukprot:636437-Pyramimonas_sp.AAC.1
MGRAAVVQRRHWGFRCSPLVGKGTVEWVEATHASTAAGAFGTVLHEATERCAGWGWRMRAVPLGAQVELPMWPRSAAL